MFKLQLRLLIVLLVFLPADLVCSQSKLPRFKDYRVTETYTGRNAPLVLKRSDRMFRTRLQEAARERPNFAGRYILTTWGCGTSCVMGAVIDARTGRVYWWDFTLCCWGYDIDENFRPVEARINSRLIVFSGARHEKEGDVGTHFYKFQNERFRHIRSILK